MNNNSDLVMLIIVVVTGLILFICWKFSQALGIDLATGARLFFGLILTAGAAIALLKFNHLNAFWPFLLGVLWIFCWPSLDYWAVESTSLFASNHLSETPWWAKWYTKVGGLIALVGGGYLYKYFFDRGY